MDDRAILLRLLSLQAWQLKLSTKRWREPGKMALGVGIHHWVKQFGFANNLNSRHERRHWFHLLAYFLLAP
jgi:hypothetical protein